MSDDIFERMAGGSKKDDKPKQEQPTAPPRQPRYTQTEINSLEIIFQHYRSTYHYRECKFWKKCKSNQKKEDRTCKCEQYRSMYPNADIVADNVASLIKKVMKK